MCIQVSDFFCRLFHQAHTMYGERSCTCDDRSDIGVQVDMEVGHAFVQATPETAEVSTQTCVQDGEDDTSSGSDFGADEWCEEAGSPHPNAQDTETDHLAAVSIYGLIFMYPI